MQAIAVVLLVILVAVCVQMGRRELRKRKLWARSQLIISAVQRLPLLKEGSGFAEVAVIRSRSEFKVLIEISSCHVTDGGITTNLCIFDVGRMRLVGFRKGTFIGHDGRIGFEATLGLTRTLIAFSILDGVTEIRKEPADHMCLVDDLPLDNPFAALAETLMGESRIDTAEGREVAMSRIVRAIDPQGGSEEDADLRGEALVWVNHRLMEFQRRAG